MRWLAATVALLCASVALAVAIYLRDRDPSNWLPPPRVAANLDAQTFLLSIHCPRAVCSYRLVDHPSRYHWVARINYGSGTGCVDIDLLAFDVAATHGFTGARPVPCPSSGRAPGA